MLDGYHRIFNQFALKEVIRDADIPQPALGIGFAELHQSLPVMLRYEPVSRIPTLEKLRTLEDISSKRTGEQMTLDQFPMTGYVGEALGGY